MVFYVWTPIADRGSGARRGPGAGPLLRVRSEGDRVAVARDGASVDLQQPRFVIFSNRTGVKSWSVLRLSLVDRRGHQSTLFSLQYMTWMVNRSIKFKKCSKEYTLARDGTYLL